MTPKQVYKGFVNKGFFLKHVRFLDVHERISKHTFRIIRR